MEIPRVRGLTKSSEEKAVVTCFESLQTKNLVEPKRDESWPPPKEIDQMGWFALWGEVFWNNVSAISVDKFL